MARDNELGKELFRLLKKNFPLTNKLHKIFNKNTVRLNYSCMPNVANLIIATVKSSTIYWVPLM